MDKIIKEITMLNSVKAVAMGGSGAANTSDKRSDIDIYVFVTESIPVFLRENIIKQISSKYEVGGDYFGSGDEFFADSLGVQYDVMYWDVNWFESTISNVWEKCQASNGYTTCFLYTLKNFSIIYDPSGWLANLKNKMKQPYPAALKQNIIRRNMMLMKDKPFASYYEQVEKALFRNDIVSVNHRISAFLASYFDVLFAVNEIMHPGEKRLISYVKDNCKIIPDFFEENISKLLNQPNPDTLNVLSDIVNELKKITPRMD